MFKKLLAMIADNYNCQIIINTFCFEEIKKFADPMVEKGNFAVIRIVTVSFRVGGRRLVGIVGIVEMYPGEARTGRVLLERLCRPLSAQPLFGTSP